MDDRRDASALNAPGPGAAGDSPDSLPFGAGARLLLVVNVDWFFLSHRLSVALAARDHGFEVHVATALTGRRHEIERHGLVVHPLPLSRASTRVGGELTSFLAIASVLRRVKPAVCHLVTIKPVTYGGVAARLLGIRTVAAISGLGTVFSSGETPPAVRRAVITLYRLALRRPGVRVVVQNRTDAAMMTDAIGVDPANVRLIPGSGVSLDHFRVLPEPRDRFRVVMASRLLGDKGVREFVDAARQVKTLRPEVEFQLAGEIDPENPTSLTAGEVAEIAESGVVSVLGQRNDIPAVFAKANLVVLPSYREGLPRVLVEAAASGRAVITTDCPGCRDAVRGGVTGLLVPPRDSRALAGAVIKLMDDSEMRQRMGREGRRLAESEFDIRRIVETHLAIYRELVVSG